MKPFETYEHAGVTVELYYDDSAVDPRRDYDHAGTIICDEYLSGGEDLIIDCPSCDGSGEIIGEPDYPIAGKGAVRVEAVRCPRCDGGGTTRVTVAEYLSNISDAELVIPLQFERSGSGGARLHHNDVEDGNANAAIYLTAETLQKEWHGDRGKARKYLEAEVDEYDSYLKGEVYGYVVKGPDGEELDSPFYDSCWGFIGDLSYVRQVANEAAEGVAESLAKEAMERAEMAARDIETIS